MMNTEELKSNPNPDLVKERKNGNVDVTKLKNFIGKCLFGSNEQHREMLDLSIETEIVSIF